MAIRADRKKGKNGAERIARSVSKMSKESEDTPERAFHSVCSLVSSVTRMLVQHAVLLVAYPSV